MKDQIIIIHGGDAFDNKNQYYYFLEQREYRPFDKEKRWRDWISLVLNDTYEIFAPEMPNKQNADYRSWKIWFEKIFPYMNQNKLTIIGYSLGGIFIAKWLSENTFPKKINQLHMVAAVFDNEGLNPRETVGDFLFDKNKLSKIQDQTEKIYIYHSKDDSVVPYSHAEKFKNLLPKANLVTLTNRNHFRQETFPELLQNIKGE